MVFVRFPGLRMLLGPAFCSASWWCWRCSSVSSFAFLNLGFLVLDSLEPAGCSGSWRRWRCSAGSSAFGFVISIVVLLCLFLEVLNSARCPGHGWVLEFARRSATPAGRCRRLRYSSSACPCISSAGGSRRPARSGHRPEGGRGDPGLWHSSSLNLPATLIAHSLQSSPWA